MLRDDNLLRVVLNDPAPNPNGGNRRVTRMQPVEIGGCFGWLHAPADGVAGNVAVLLCPGLRDDGLSAHSHFRQLASEIADSGYACLRFDYPGTGDSCAALVGGDLWQIWLQSIHRAADWLCVVTGCRQLIFCGLRLGATLAAAAAAQRQDVIGLGLLAPMPYGRTFLRQLKIEAGLAGKAPSAALRLQGIPISPDTLQSIASVRLDDMVPPPNCTTAIFNQPMSQVLEQCAQAWRARGRIVKEVEYAGLLTILRPRIMAHERPADFRPVTRWLSSAAPRMSARRVLPTTPPILRHPGCKDVPLRYGEGGGLFGMLCQPADGNANRAILILNSGGDPHYGVERGSWVMAQRLASAGIASLRIDFAGLGDSVAPGDPQTHVFETDRRLEVAAALDTLSRRGFQKFSICGICSGAYHAFHAGVADDRIDSLLLINLPTFDWQAGTKIEFFALTEHKLGERAHKLGQPLIWWRMLSTKGEFYTRLQIEFSRLGGQASRWLRRTALRLGWSLPLSITQRAATQLATHARTLMLMAPTEVGLSVLESEFGHSRTPPGSILHVLPGIDHSLTDPSMHVMAADMMIDFLETKAVMRDSTRPANVPEQWQAA